MVIIVAIIYVDTDVVQDAQSVLIKTINVKVVIVVVIFVKVQ